MKSLPNFITDTPKLWVQGEAKETSAQFMAQLCQNVRHYVLAITGGCGFMDEADGSRMGSVEKALRGYEGYGLCSGTEMRSLEDPNTILPAIPHIFTAIRSSCPKAKFLGIAARTSTMQITRYGMLISVSPGTAGNFAVANPNMDALLILQDNADKPAPWEREWKERVDLVNSMQPFGWGACLIVYNGGTNTRKEVETWAALGRINQDYWNVLLIKGSGRVADELANDQDFLTSSPTVHVVEINSDQIRAKLVELGAVFGNNLTEGE